MYIAPPPVKPVKEVIQDTAQSQTIINNDELQTIQLQTPGEMNNNALEVNDKTPSMINTTQQDNKDIVIRKKRQFRMFLKLIKEDKFTTAMMSAKIIGVDRATIDSWLRHRRVTEVMNKSIDSMISKIQGSNDWKAQAYLLDKIQPSKDEEGKQDLKQLIVINT